VLRTDLCACGSFRELLRRVRDVSLEGYANQELPFDRIVEALRPPRDSQRPPFYQVKLTYTTGGVSLPDLPGLSAEWLSADKGTAQLDLTLFLSQQGE